MDFQSGLFGGEISLRQFLLYTNIGTPTKSSMFPEPSLAWQRLL